MTPDVTIGLRDWHYEPTCEDESGETETYGVGGSSVVAPAYYRAPPLRPGDVVAMASLVRFRGFEREWGPSERTKKLDPTVVAPPAGVRRDEVPDAVLPWWRFLVPAVLSAGTTAGGFVLLIASTTSHRTLLNPYIELGLFLGGLVLIATFVTTVRGSGWTIE